MHAIVLSLLIIVSIILFALPVKKRLIIVASAPGKFNLDNLGERAKKFILEVLFQSKVIKHRPLAGTMHALVMWGFLAFIIITLNHFGGGYGWRFLCSGLTFKIISTIVAVFAVLVIIGICGLTFRRFILRPKALGEKLSWGSGLVAFLIAALMVTYLFDIYWFEKGTPASCINWWAHSVMILGFLAFIPQSKHLHLVLSPFTVFLKDLKLARIRPLDFEKEEMGAEKLTDIEKHTALASFTCVECGRCFDQCPARFTGKTLDPKKLMLDIRKGLLIEPIPEDTSAVLNMEMIWQCTTCGACTYQCPVGVDQVIPIIGLRRGLVSNGEFPAPMRALFDNLERSGNPWKYQPHQALEFIESAQIPLYDGQETIYWMGCMGRYDDHYRKVAASFAEILKKAGIDFGVLVDEKCTGDAARRAGNEFLFQSLAGENIEILNAAKAKRLVTTCPHCLRTLEEYRDLGLRMDLRLQHHTSFLNELINSKKIKLSGSIAQPAAYQDPCYLSRYQYPSGVLEARRILNSSGVKLTEPGRCRERSFCCGAGGGMLFSEETEGKRINYERVEELLSTGAKTIITSCPFCQMMLRDALADKGIEAVKVMDIIQ
jgi:Fe-S oxidoreductase